MYQPRWLNQEKFRHSYKFITSEIARPSEFQSMLEDGKATELTKHERKSKADESEECDAR